MSHPLFLTSITTAVVLLTQTAFAEIDLARQNELLYFLRQDCGSCHGMTMKGGLGPALLPETLSAKPEEFLVYTILEGRPGTAMPPWKPMLSYDDAVWMAKQLQKGLPTKIIPGQIRETTQ